MTSTLSYFRHIQVKFYRYEIIVVDDSNNFETKHAIEGLRYDFSKRNIKLIYTRDSNSAARACLIGELMAQGDVIIYIDDDLHLRYKSES